MKSGEDKFVGYYRASVKGKKEKNYSALVKLCPFHADEAIKEAHVFASSLGGVIGKCKEKGC